MRLSLLFYLVTQLACSECEERARRCSVDAQTLSVCVDGSWQETDCLGQLCEEGACVDPWRYKSPSYSSCPNEADTTAETLFDKMQTYQTRASDLHFNPELGWITDVMLPCATVECSPAETPPCYDCNRPAVSEANATPDDVVSWERDANDGLWTSLHLAAEGFRYGATGDPQVLAIIRTMLASLEARMRISGVPGIFVRTMVPPDVEGISCPDRLTSYIPDVEKDDNKWVRIDDQGCINVVNGETLTWESTDACGLEEFAGWCWLDNVSQDEYSGHIFALGVLGKLLADVPDVNASVTNMLDQVCQHLVDNQLQLVDWDGRITEHGRLWVPVIFGGFHAVQALNMMKMCAEVTGNPTYDQWHRECMLHQNGPRDCVNQPAGATEPYHQLLSDHFLYVGTGNCKSNFNGISMHMLSMHNLIWYETDPELRAIYQKSLRDEVFAPPDTKRAVAEQHNTLFDFIYAAQKALGPGSDGPAYDAVEDGICMLKQFPASKQPIDKSCEPPDCEIDLCLNRFDRPVTTQAQEIADRCVKRWMWWHSPYDPPECNEEPRHIWTPTDYLLTYWMGRYYGFIDETL